MNKNKIVLVIMVVLVTIALSFVLTEKNSTLFGSNSDFAVKDTANIVKIYMADKNNKSVLFERGEKGWTLNGDGIAHKKNVDMLLTTIKSLEVKYPVPQKAHDNVIKVMAGNSVKVEVYKNDYRIELGQLKLFPYVNKAKTYYVGAATQDNQGTYMLMEGAERAFVVTIPGFRGFVAARFTTNPKDWLSHEIFRIPYHRIAEVKIESTEQANKNYQIRKLEEGYEIMSLSNRQILGSYDTVALYTFLDAFKDINYESLLDDMPQTKVDSILNAEPVFVISVKETNGEEHQIKTYKMYSRYDQEEIYGFKPEYDLDRMYAWNNNQMMMIQYFVFDKITRPVDFFYPPQQ
jgi:hypothetical protein